MRLCDLQNYINVLNGDTEFGILIRSIETGEELVMSYDVIADISEYGELLLSICIESCEVGFLNTLP